MIASTIAVILLNRLWINAVKQFALVFLSVVAGIQYTWALFALRGMLVASVESLGGVQRVTEAETKIRHRSENRQQTTSPSHPDPTISPSQPVVSKALPENLNSNLLSVSISKKPSILKSNDVNIRMPFLRLPNSL